MKVTMKKLDTWTVHKRNLTLIQLVVSWKCVPENLKKVCEKFLNFDLPLPFFLNVLTGDCLFFVSKCVDNA
jgi:hypothetical protein